MSKEYGKLDLRHCDCMDMMREFPNNHFELAIVDPPYGIDVNKMQLGSGKYKSDKTWDSCVPNIHYFNELRRVSVNQVVWGANYMTDKLPPSMGWVFWNKMNGTSDFSDGELAYTSFNRALRMFSFHLSQEKSSRFHPTQKPIALYKWLLQNYAKEGDKILDTHGGSMSIAIACYYMGFDLTLSELDEDYYKAGVERVNKETSQQELF